MNNDAIKIRPETLSLLNSIERMFPTLKGIKMAIVDLSLRKGFYYWDKDRDEHNNLILVYVPYSDLSVSSFRK